MRMKKDDVLINDYYNDHKYHLFLDYCTQHQLLRMKDLKGFDFHELKNQKGIGLSKIEQIQNHYNDFYDEGYVYETKENKKQTLLFQTIHEEAGTLPIRVLTTFKVKANLVEYLEKAGMTTLDALKQYTVDSLGEAIGIRMAGRISRLEDTFSKPIIDILTMYINENKKKVYYHVYLRRSRGETLQDIASNMGITRERVRQIELHFYKQILILCEAIGDRMMSSKGYINDSDIQALSRNKEIEDIIRYTFKRSDKFEYLKFASVFLLPLPDGRSHKSCLLEIASDVVEEGYDMSEGTDDLQFALEKNGYGFIDLRSFYHFLKMNGYHNYGPFIIKGSQSYAYLCEKIIERDYPEGIKLYDHEALDGLRHKVWEKFGKDVQLPANDRAFSARLSECLVLCGRGSVTAAKNVRVSMSVLNQLVQYIDHYETSIIYYSEIFARFEEILKETSSITNYNYLHGVLMLYYPTRYEYSRDYLMHKQKMTNVIPLNERIKKFIAETNRPVSKKELKDKFIGISDVVVNRMVTEDRDLVQWENGYYSISSLFKITDDEKNKLRQILENLLKANNGYCSGEMLYREVDKEMPILISKNNIQNSTNLFYFTQQIFYDNYQFRRPHIGRLDLPFEITARSIALHFLYAFSEISYKKFKTVAAHFMWPEATSAIVFTEIVQDYVRINEDEYVSLGCFKIDKKDIALIEQILHEMLQKETYIAISCFKSYDLFPVIGYPWNMYLLRDILNHFSTEFNIIDVQVLDRRFEKGVITLKESGFKDMSHLVAYLLSEKGKHKVEETRLLSLLNNFGFVMKDIPLELYNSSYLTYKDGTFIVNEANIK